MKKFWIGLVVVLVLLVGGYYLFNSSEGNVTGNVVATNDDVKVFVVDSSHLRFYIDGVENPDMKVKEGERVRVEFTSSEGFHDWGIDEFYAFTERVMPGDSTFVEFVADKKGTFEYYCTVGQHRANGMKGNFIVE